MAAPEEAGSYPSPAVESHHAPLAEATPPRRQDTNHADVIYQPPTIDNEVHTPPKKTGGAGAYLTAQYESGKFSSSPTATARLPSSSTASKKQQKLGQQSRLRQDRASGALDYVAGRYNTKDGARHTVNNALRHGIGDAYAAYVGQVCELPQNLYGLALYGLDRAYNKSGRVHDIDFNLHTSPFLTSRTKHALIFNTARKVLHSLEGYVHEVAPYLPGELDQLQQMRASDASGTLAAMEGKAAATPGGKQGHMSRAEQQALQAQLVDTPPRGTPPTAQRQVSAGRGGRGGPGPQAQSVRMRQPDFGAATASGDTTPATTDEPPTPPHPHQKPLSQQQQAAAAATAGRSSSGARQRPASAGAVPRRTKPHPRTPYLRQNPVTGVWTTVEGPLDEEPAAIRAYEAEMAAGGVKGARGAVTKSPKRLTKRVGLEGITSPGMFVKVPPHMRVAKFYDHVKPAEEVLQYMRLKGVEEQALRNIQAIHDATTALPPTQAPDGTPLPPPQQPALSSWAQSQVTAVQSALSTIPPERQVLLDKLLGPSFHHELGHGHGRSRSRTSSPRRGSGYRGHYGHAVPVSDTGAVPGVDGQDAAAAAAMDPAAQAAAAAAAAPEDPMAGNDPALPTMAMTPKADTGPPQYGEYGAPAGLSSKPVPHGSAGSALSDQILRVLHAAQELQMQAPSGGSFGPGGMSAYESYGYGEHEDGRSRRVSPSPTEWFYTTAYMSSGGSTVHMRSRTPSPAKSQSYYEGPAYVAPSVRAKLAATRTRSAGGVGSPGRAGHTSYTVQPQPHPLVVAGYDNAGYCRSSRISQW